MANKNKNKKKQNRNKLHSFVIASFVFPLLSHELVTCDFQNLKKKKTAFSTLCRCAPNVERATHLLASTSICLYNRPNTYACQFAFFEWMHALESALVLVSLKWRLATPLVYTVRKFSNNNSISTQNNTNVSHTAAYAIANPIIMPNAIHSMRFVFSVYGVHTINGKCATINKFCIQLNYVNLFSFSFISGFQLILIELLFGLIRCWNPWVHWKYTA